LTSVERAPNIDNAGARSEKRNLVMKTACVWSRKYWYGKTMVGKVVADPSNPVAPNGKGGFDKIIPVDQSSGEIVAGLLPPGAALVKAFGVVAADSLGSGANRKPERAVLFYATDFPGGRPRGRG